MARTPNLSFKRVRLGVAGVVVACVLAGATLTVAATINSQFSSGSIRLSSSSSSSSVSITGTSGPDSLKRVIRTEIKVPSGKTADVQATFSASLLHNVGTFAYCFGRFTLDGASSDGAAFNPGTAQLLGGETATMPNAVGVAMIGYKKGIGPGSHYVNVYINSAYAGCQLQERGLNVIVNFH